MSEHAWILARELRDEAVQQDRFAAEAVRNGDRQALQIARARRDALFVAARAVELHYGFGSRGVCP